MLSFPVRGSLVSYSLALDLLPLLLLAVELVVGQAHVTYHDRALVREAKGHGFQEYLRAVG